MTTLGQMNTIKSLYTASTSQEESKKIIQNLNHKISTEQEFHYIQNHTKTNQIYMHLQINLNTTIIQGEFINILSTEQLRHNNAQMNS